MHGDVCVQEDGDAGWRGEEQGTGASRGRLIGSEGEEDLPLNAHRAPGGGGYGDEEFAEGGEGEGEEEEAAEDEGLLEEALVLSAPTPAPASKKPKKAKADAAGTQGPADSPGGGEGGQATPPVPQARNFRCPHEGCNKAYIHEYKLNLHRRTMHGEDAPPPDPKASQRAKKRAKGQQSEGVAGGAPPQGAGPEEGYPYADAEEAPKKKKKPAPKKAKGSEGGGPRDSEGSPFWRESQRTQDVYDTSPGGEEEEGEEGYGREYAGGNEEDDLEYEVQLYDDQPRGPRMGGQRASLGSRGSTSGPRHRGGLGLADPLPLQHSGGRPGGGGGMRAVEEDEWEDAEGGAEEEVEEDGEGEEEDEDGERGGAEGEEGEGAYEEEGWDEEAQGAYGRGAEDEDRPLRFS